MTKLLYIASLGHSGSTILDLLCGNLPGVVSLGEAHFISWQLSKRGKSNDPQSHCSCGRQFGECAFWNPVISSLGEEHSFDIFSNPEGFDMSINRNLKRYGNNFRHRLLDHLLYLSARLRIPPLGRSIEGTYRDSALRTWKMFDHVSRQANAEWVVDSSKNLARYFHLRSLRPDDTKLLVLIRGVEGFSSSSHHGINDALVSQRMRSWKRFYGKIARGSLKRFSPGEFMIVSYETLCQNPVVSLQQIARLLGIDHEVTDKDTVLMPHERHTIQGNPLRLKKEPIHIRYDERWRSRLTLEQAASAQELSESVYAGLRERGYEII